MMSEYLDMDEFSDWSHSMLNVDEQILRADQPIVCHLNGRDFKHFTHRLTKPYDEKFQNAMTETARRLAHQCGANFVYTIFDTITLVRYHRSPNASIWCGNSRDRIMSTTASFASVDLNELCKEMDLPVTWRGAFSAKAFNMPTPQATAMLLTCIEKEFQMRALNTMSKFHFGKGPHGLKEAEVKRRLREAGKAWEEMPARFKHGIAFKTRKIDPTEENGHLIRNELRPIATPLHFRESLEDDIFGV